MTKSGTAYSEITFKDVCYWSTMQRWSTYNFLIHTPLYIKSSVWRDNIIPLRDLKHPIVIQQ